MPKKPDNQEQRNGEELDLARLLSGAAAASGRPLLPEEMIQHLQERGYRIVREDPIQARKQPFVLKATKMASRWKGGKTLRFGVVSDTHLGSQKQQLTFLHNFYDRAAERGIATILHVGDLVDGDGRVYPGQEYDLFLHGYDRQLSYAAEHYPRREGIETYLIAGNHDWSFHQRKGADILAALAERRKDIKYLGPLAAQLDIDGIRIQLTHGKGGLTYARSYRAQRMIEAFTPENKPHLFFLGDRHSWNHLPNYRNVVGWQVGCWQSQTEHEKRLGIFPEIGGLFVEVDYGTEGADRPGGIVAVRDEVATYFVPLERDY